MKKLAHETLRRKIGDSRVGRSPIRDIGYVSDLFARLLNERLRTLLRWPVVVEVDSYEVMKFGPAIGQAENGALFAVAQVSSNFGGTVILNPSFLFGWLDALTGCDGSIADPESIRDFTSIDATLTQDFVGNVIDSFERAILPEANSKAIGSLSFSRFIKDRSSILDAEDTMDVLNIRMSMKIGGAEQARSFDMLVPLGVLDVYKAAEKGSKPDKAANADAKKNETLWASTMLAAANEAEFRLVAVLHEKKMNVGDIRDLKPGSVILLPHVRKMPIELRMDTAKGVAREPTVGNGALGVVDGQRAIRMSEPLMEEFTNYLQSFSMHDSPEHTQIDRMTGAA